MKRIGIVGAVGVLVFAVIFIALRHSAPSHKGAAKLAPEFSLTDISGKPLRLSDFRGKVVILDFWATWCEPCKEEIPRFIELQNKYGPRGLQVLGISMDDSEPPVREFQQQYKMNYPVAVGSSKLADQFGGVLGLPITFLINRQGQIVTRHVGATALAVFEQEIQRLF